MTQSGLLRGFRFLSLCNQTKIRIRLKSSLCNQTEWSRSFLSSSMLSPLNRSLGLLYGQFIGDALGSRYEFMKGKEVIQKLDADRDESGFVPLLGDGPFGYGPGVVTDDGEMAMSFLSSFLHHNSFDASSVACAYVRWAQSNPPDIGNTCSGALTLRKEQTQLWEIPKEWQSEFSAEDREKIREAVERNVKSRNDKSLSNGALMRQSVLTALYSSEFFIGTEERSGEGAESDFVSRLLSAVEADTLLTHSNPVAIEASKVYALLLFHLIRGRTPEEALKSAFSTVSFPVLRSLLEKAEDRPVPVFISEEKESNGDDACIGYLGVALQVSVHFLLHSSSFSDGLLSVVSVGGDTDTNAAIAGALLGARWGAYGIPSEWAKTVEDAPLRMKGENGIESFDQMIEGVKKRYEESPPSMI
ncbi:hypothetical protein PMAYCL1PPCAC_02585 [Pristionchus mayeri]|uniref:ADP-ribosylhydrolase ARH3 n=1 Tax=Pristionchus mayeri TaxID=1317129 RepID=A0AAN5C6D6_9BILA|nr:hypothetical protein PMAYCL1PPCAC_02585 [Pristionchus mayeri]